MFAQFGKPYLGPGGHVKDSNLDQKLLQHLPLQKKKIKIKEIKKNIILTSKIQSQATSFSTDQENLKIIINIKPKKAYKIRV